MNHDFKTIGATVALVCIATTSTFAQAVRLVPGELQNGTLNAAGQALPEFGASVAALGDTDGDNVPDYAVGSPGDGNNAGRVQLYASGSAMLQTLAAGIGADRVGESIASIGDLDDDGVADLLIGKPGHAVGTAASAGGFEIVSGKAGAPILSGAGTTAGERMGRSVAYVGSFTPSGLPRIDLHAVCTDAGRVDFYQDTAPTPFGSISGPGVTGSVVTGIGLWDGNIFPDFAVRRDGDRVELRGTANGAITGALGVLQGPVGSEYGFAMASATQLDNGTPVLVVGAPGAMGGMGQVDFYVPGANVPFATFVGFAAGDRLGESVGYGGDVDGDGDQDFVIGTRGGNYAFIIDAFGTAAARSIVSPVALPMSFGASAQIVGDRNGDGFAEILIGDPGLANTYVMFGGPDAGFTATGGGCTVGGNTCTPTLTGLGVPTFGTTIGFNFSGFLTTTPSITRRFVLETGASAPQGVPGVGTCQLWIDAPITINASGIMPNLAGPCLPPGLFTMLLFPMPADPASAPIGAKWGHQALAFTDNGAGPQLPFEFSNGIEVTLGW